MNTPDQPARRRRSPPARRDALGLAAACTACVAPALAAAPSEAGGGSRVAAHGMSRHEILSAGRRRAFELDTPRSVRADRPVALVFDLHASSITPAVELQITRMDEAAEREGFILALPVAVTPYPQGGTTWNVPHREGVDDVAFVAEVLDWLLARFPVDPARVYATGFSGGARLASALAWRLPDRFAAVSVVGGLQGPDPGPDGGAGARGVPLLAVHGVEDPVNPFDGDPRRSPDHWTHGVEEAITRWRTRLACTAAEVSHLGSRIERRRYTSCGGAELAAYILRGSGHTWPGSRFAFPEALGPVEPTLDATALSVAWFQRFALPTG